MRSKYILQRQSNFVTIRLRIPVGIIYPEQLDTIKQISAKFGAERIHLTVRKTVEIPGIPLEKVEQVIEELAAVGLHTTTLGDNIRNVVSCPGIYSCPNSRIDTQTLGLEIDSNLMLQEDLPAKIKIAIAGCPNNCTHPQINDIGIVGVAKVAINEDECDGCYSCIDYCREEAIKKTEKGKAIIDKSLCIDCGQCVQCKGIILKQTCYRIMVGGKLGRKPQFGTILGDFSTIYNVLDKLEQILLAFKEFGEPEERLGIMINRISIEKFIKLIS